VGCQSVKPIPLLPLFSPSVAWATMAIPHVELAHLPEEVAHSGCIWVLPHTLSCPQFHDESLGGAWPFPHPPSPRPKFQRLLVSELQAAWCYECRGNKAPLGASLAETNTTPEFLTCVLQSLAEVWRDLVSECPVLFFSSFTRVPLCRSGRPSTAQLWSQSSGKSTRPNSWHWCVPPCLFL
jgi:hypothetical protein